MEETADLHWHLGLATSLGTLLRTAGVEVHSNERKQPSRVLRSRTGWPVAPVGDGGSRCAELETTSGGASL